MTVQDVEDAMADVMLAKDYQRTVVMYHGLLEIMGNVDGDEVVALVLLAHQRVIS